MTVASARVYPVMVQATVEYVASKTVWKVGSATLTTVVSRIDMIAPRTTTLAIFITRASSLSPAPGGADGVAGEVIRAAPVLWSETGPETRSAIPTDSGSARRTGRQWDEGHRAGGTGRLRPWTERNRGHAVGAGPGRR